MPGEVQARIVSGSQLAAEQTAARNRTENEKNLPITFTNFSDDPNITRAPQYYIHVYNISPRAREVRRPPSFPLIRFAACPKGQPYIKAAEIPNIVNEKWVDAASGEIRNRGIIGERFAMDLLNPTNLGIDCWQEITDDAQSWIDAGGTDDLTRRGLFWTLNDPPKQWELDRAKERLEKHYRNMLLVADSYWQSPDADQKRNIGREHHDAADYYRVKNVWHTVAELPSLCPNCGENLPNPNVPYHRNSLGERCVIDWKRTLESGVIKKSDVPESKRWWVEAKSA